MTQRVRFGLCAVLGVVCARVPFAQERQDRTLLSHQQMRASALLDEARAAYTLQAAQRKTAAIEPAMTAEEREASTLAIECVNGSRFSGCNPAPGAGGDRGAGPGGGSCGGRGGVPSNRPQQLNAEATILSGQKKTALDVRDFLAGEFNPLPLADLMSDLRAREQAGVTRLVKR